MTSTGEHDLTIPKMYLHKMNSLREGFYKLEHYRQTHRQMGLKTLPHCIRGW